MAGRESPPGVPAGRISRVAAATSSPLSQVASSLGAGNDPRVEGRGTRRADGSIFAATIKAEHVGDQARRPLARKLPRPQVMSLDQTWGLLARKLTGWGRALILALPNFLLAVLTVVLSWLVAKAVRNVVTRLLRRVSHSEQVTYLLSQMVYIAVLTAGTFIALGILGLQKTVASLLAGAGIVGLALGFAFQDIAANLMAGVYLSVRRPFRRGHLVKTQDFFGIVMEVNLRWTELLTQQGQLVLIPNKQVFENPIMNYTIRGTRRVDIAVGVSYGDDLEKVKQVAIEAVSAVPSRLPDREVELFFEEFGESSIDFTLRFWIPFETQKDYLAARSDAIIRIKRAFDAEGITIPFPIRTLDFAAEGGETLDEVLQQSGIARVSPRR